LLQFFSTLLFSPKSRYVYVNPKKPYQSVSIRLKKLPLYLLKLMVNSFENIGSLLSVNIIDLWGVALSNLVDYTGFCTRICYWAACNSEMYFVLCGFPLWFKVAHSNSQELKCKSETVGIIEVWYIIFENINV
jgi:hypothetical protein